MAYNLRFDGCTFKGELISPPVAPTLSPGTHQEFIFSSVDDGTLVSGNCTYHILELNHPVEFQWYVNSETGHEFYGITHNPVYFHTLVAVHEKTHYFIFDT